jgi:hypothetical protein
VNGAPSSGTAVAVVTARRLGSRFVRGPCKAANDADFLIARDNPNEDRGDMRALVGGVERERGTSSTAPDGPGDAARDSKARARTARNPRRMDAIDDMLENEPQDVDPRTRAGGEEMIEAPFVHAQSELSGKGPSGSS